MSYSNINLLVVRHEVNKINEIRQVKASCEQLGINITGIIYNGYKKPSNYYGYYGIYGNYSYAYYANKYLYDRYNYDEGKE